MIKSVLALLAVALLPLAVQANHPDHDDRRQQRPLCSDRPAVGSFLHQLVTVVESDALPEVVIRFYALTDLSGDLVGLMTHRTDHPVARIYGLCEIRRGDVNVEQNGRLITQLTAPSFSGSEGGQIQFSFLFNGITGARRFVRFHVSRTGARDWRLFWDPTGSQSRTQPFNYLWMARKTLLGRTIGIGWVGPELIDLKEYEDYEVPMPSSSVPVR